MADGKIKIWEALLKDGSKILVKGTSISIGPDGDILIWNGGVLSGQLVGHIAIYPYEIVNQ